MKRLERDTDNGRVAGLCSGIGKTFDVDPTIVRLIVIFATIATGLLPGVITYLLGWLITPSSRTLLS